MQSFGSLEFLSIFEFLAHCAARRRPSYITRLRLNPSGSKCLLDIKHFLRGCFAVSFIFYTGSDDNKFSTHNCLHKKFNNGLPLSLLYTSTYQFCANILHHLLHSFLKNSWTWMIFYDFFFRSIYLGKHTCYECIFW